MLFEAEGGWEGVEEGMARKASKRQEERLLWLEGRKRKRPSEREGRKPKDGEGDGVGEGQEQFVKDPESAREGSWLASATSVRGANPPRVWRELI